MSGAVSACTWNSCGRRRSGDARTELQVVGGDRLAVFAQYEGIPELQDKSEQVESEQRMSGEQVRVFATGGTAPMS